MKTNLPIPACLSLCASISLLSSCGGTPKEEAVSSTERFGKPAQIGQAAVGLPPKGGPPTPRMQPLQTGQPPQRPEKSVSTIAPVVGGNPGTNVLPFSQPFRLADTEYQFMAARGKDYVGLETSPALRPVQGNSYFLVRYQVINHGQGIATVPNNAAVHLVHKVTNQVTDIDVAATNANVESGAATGMPNQLTLEPERPQIQTLAFQIPSSVNANDIAILVNEPRDPTRVFQLVQVSN